MAISRGNSLLMKKQWAEDGSTVIPNPPVAGTTYRDESVDEANIAEGQQYDGVADSARWNQLLYIMTGILKDTLAHGVLPWINTQDYAEGAVVMGSNGTLYIAKIANGPTTTNVKDPTTDATANTWKTVLAISSVGEGLQIESNKLKLSPYKGATALEAGELGGVPPAAKEDKDKFLKGDGTWAGVVRSVNGNAPDSNGNITPAQTGCLPLAGGTMTGSINSENIDQIKITNADVSIGDTSRSSTLYNKPITVLDKNGKRGGAVEISWYTDGSRSFGFSMRGREDSGYIFCGAREWPNGYVSFECNDSLVFLPSGAVFAFAANSAPAGCLLCNGAAVSRTTYAALYAAIGTTYGSGDGSTTFNLPNLTDTFIQGSNTAGTVKSAGLPNITGTTSSFDWVDSNAMSGAFKASSLYDQKYAGTYTSRSANNNFDASRCSSIYGKSTTVQPPALTMRYYIKY